MPIGLALNVNRGGFGHYLGIKLHAHTWEKETEREQFNDNFASLSYKLGSKNTMLSHSLRLAFLFMQGPPTQPSELVDACEQSLAAPESTSHSYCFTITFTLMLMFSQEVCDSQDLILIPYQLSDEICWVHLSWLCYNILHSPTLRNLFFCLDCSMFVCVEMALSQRF